MSLPSDTGDAASIGWDGSASTHAAAWKGFANVMKDLGDFRTAARALGRALALVPGDVDAHAQLMWNLLQADMVAPASGAVKRAVDAQLPGPWWVFMAGIQLFHGRGDVVYKELLRQVQHPDHGACVMGGHWCFGVWVCVMGGHWCLGVCA